MSTYLAKPPFSQTGRLIESMVRKAVHDYALIDEPKIAIALSGGKDSLTLLFMLNALSERGFPKLDLQAIYVKGEFSCGPGITEGYLKEICDAMGVPLAAVSSSPKREKLECYSCSRERRRLIFETATSLGYKTIAFGHHGDDNIQTLFLNLFHKGEFEGNLPKVPMHGFGITIIRPLIYVYEKEIVAFARHHGFARITCQCPVGQDSKRKQVSKIIEAIEQEFPNIRTNLALSARTYGTQKALKLNKE